MIPFTKFFKKYFAPFLLEMRQDYVNAIGDFIENVEERPFPDLFGDKDRFIVKTKLAEACEDLGLNPAGFDIENGFYVDENGKKNRYGAVFKQKLAEYTAEHGEENVREVVDKISTINKALTEKQFNPYLVYSRHPLDVLRMSDINNISSCHSQGGGWFHCAQQEAQNLGGIVYLINPKDYEEVKDKLDEPEIFEDPERGIPGIKAQARVRLRKFVDSETGEDFAVPEKRYYTPEGKMEGYSGGISNDIVDYTKKHQSIFQKQLSPEYIEKNISHVGGQYTDTDYDELLTNFFELPEYAISGEIKSSTKAPISRQALTKIIERIENSKNPKKDFPNVNATRAFSLLNGLEQIDKDGTKYPKTRDYALNALATKDLDRYTHADEIRRLILKGTNIGNYTKILENIMIPIQSVMDDLQYDEDPKMEEGIKNFLYTNSDALKHYMKNRKYESGDFYRIGYLMSPFVRFLKEKGDPTNLIKSMKQSYFEKMADMGYLDRYNIKGFEETFGESLFKYLDDTNQWEEFLTIGGKFNPYDNWFEEGSGRYGMLEYPKALKTMVNLMNSSLQAGDENVLTISKLLANDKFATFLKEDNPQAFENMIKSLVTLDLQRISEHKVYLAIANLIRGDSRAIGEEIQKYKEPYINAFRNHLLKHGKYMSEDSLRAFERIFNILRDNYSWYEMKTLDDGPLDIINNIRREQNKDHPSSYGGVPVPKFR